jgi:hypothetical protein
MKRKSTIERESLVKKLNWLERKHKRNTKWDRQVLQAFTISGSYSFEDLAAKDCIVAGQLIQNFQ